jgi:hypothetical protein
MLIVRLIAALVLGGAGGAQDASQVSGGSAEDTAPVAGGDPAPLDETGPNAGLDDRLPLPYEEGQAAAWLAETLAGAGPYASAGAPEDVDLAALAAQAAASDNSDAAQCDASHVMLVCRLSPAPDGPAYSFGLEGDGQGGWRVSEGSVQAG